MKPTSRAGHDHIQPFKPNHKQKILEGMERLRIGGNHEELSVVSGLRPDQCWKRLGEMEKDGTIFNTGITRKLKSGLQGIVWQKVGLKPTEISTNPKTMKEKKNLDTIKQLSFL
jgi:hypothetical protein